MVFGVDGRKRGFNVPIPSWHGSLLEGKRDRSGLEYRRNRQYDPATGHCARVADRTDRSNRARGSRRFGGNGTVRSGLVADNL